MTATINPIDNVYDYEREAIMKLYAEIYNKWKTRQNNRHNIMEFHKEVIYRFEEIGFDVDIDFLEYLDDVRHEVHPPRPPVLVIIGRTEPFVDFDHEFKAHEVKQARKEGKQ